MMPDLGKYAETVLWSYLAAVVLLVVLVAMSVWRGRKIRADLTQVEERVSRDG